MHRATWQYSEHRCGAATACPGASVGEVGLPCPEYPLRDLQLAGFIALDGLGKTGERIVAAIVACDQAEALGRVDPLDRTGRLSCHKKLFKDKGDAHYAHLG